MGHFLAVVIIADVDIDEIKDSALFGKVRSWRKYLTSVFLFQHLKVQY